jgi:hypothetical protein
MAAASVQSTMQLDFFDDSHVVALRNDVIVALQHCDVAAAELALAGLGQHHPDDEYLADFRLLIGVLQERSPVPLSTHADLCAQRLQLQDTITPAARAGLGASAARPWLQQRWHELAQCAATLPFCAEQVQDHAAPLWLQARQWQAAADAVAQIESWRRKPAPLSWMLQARLQLQGLQSNWALLAELAWLAPQRLQTVVQQTAEPILQALVTRFEANFEGAGNADDLAWLPAWVLIERPALASQLTQAQPGQHTPAEQAMRTLLELLGLERQGRQREVVAHRKTLRGLNSALYAAYMAAR